MSCIVACAHDVLQVSERERVLMTMHPAARIDSSSSPI